MTATNRTTSRALFDNKEAASEQSPAERSELSPGSPLFPQQLLHLKDVPKRLYALGAVKALEQPSIAIVGARKATPYGLECAKRFATLAAEMGVAVVSGGAIGCDMAAHRGALDAGGVTVVVLGSGADVVYPLRAKSLFKEVLENGGVLLSEAPWGSAPLAWAFSKRNRIIAALAQATLIVEAGLPSGTFQTADHTLALGNEVLVVPGPIFSKESKGSNRLLAQGAIPIIDDDYFKETLMQIFSHGSTPQQLSFELVEEEGKGEEDSSINDLDQNKGEEVRSAEGASQSPQEIKERRLTERIIAALAANPSTIDSLAVALKSDVVEVIRLMSKLEVTSQVERLRDGRYMTKPTVKRAAL